VNYTVHTIMRDRVRYPDSLLPIEVFMNREQVRLLSQEISVYQDETDNLTVLPGCQVIFWDDSTLKWERGTRLKTLLMLPEAFFELARVRACREIQFKVGKAGKQVVLALPSEMRKPFPMQTLTFQINPAEQSLHQVLIEYLESHPTERIEISFHEINFDSQTDVLNEPVREAFFNEKQKLLPKYSGFRLIARRSRSHLYPDRSPETRLDTSDEKNRSDSQVGRPSTHLIALDSIESLQQVFQKDTGRVRLLALLSPN